MTKPREYLVRTPDGHDYGRDADLDDARRAADELGEGAQVIALDDFLLPIRDGDGYLVVYIVGEGVDENDDEEPPGLRWCPYQDCLFSTFDAGDLDKHLISTPTEAPEHGGLPKRVPCTPDGQPVQA